MLRHIHFKIPRDQSVCIHCRIFEYSVGLLSKGTDANPSVWKCCVRRVVVPSLYRAGSQPLFHVSHVSKMAERWKCVLCSFVCLFLSQLLSHLNSVHREEVNFHQECGLPGCSSKTQYTSTNSFVKHCRMHHRAILGSTYEEVFSGTLCSNESSTNEAGQCLSLF